MCFDKAVRLSASWQGRQETDASREVRLRTFLHHSRTPGRHWYGYAGENEIVDMTSDPDQVTRFLADALAESQEGEYAFAPGMGSTADFFALENGDDLDVDAPAMSIMWGMDHHNHANLTSNTDGPVDPRLVTYDVVRANLLAMVAAFEPEWCEAYPMKLRLYHDYAVYNRPAIGLCWMVWLCAAYSKLIEMPSNFTHIIRETYADGSLFFAAGTEAFDCDSPIHVGCARDIQRQIDPLNYTLPFDGRWGRSDRVPPFPKV